MSQQARDANNITSDFEEYRHKYHNELRDGCLKVRFAEKFLNCPFCPDSRDYSYNDLLRHAKRIVTESKSASIKEIAKHMELFEYLEKDFKAKIKCFNSTSVNPTIQRNTSEELTVWPWMAVVANIPVECNGNGGKKVKDDWIEEGYNTTGAHFFLDSHSNSGLAIVEFGKTWVGFAHVMAFVKAFEVRKHGRKEWYNREKCKDNKLYAWVATDEDYNSYGLVGDFLRKNGGLKTVADVQKEEESVLVELKTVIDDLDKEAEEINDKISKTDIQFESTLKQKEEMTQNFKRDTEMMQKEAKEQLKVITKKHKRTEWLLEDREKGLRAREAINKLEKAKLDNETRLIKSAILEKKKANERALKVAEDQKREIEKLHQKIIELEKKLDNKQQLELEIKQLKGALEVMKYMTDERLEAKNKLQSIQSILKEKEEELENLQDLTWSLVIKERKTNDEFVEAHKELIRALSEITCRGYIGVKRMGKLDEKPFIAAAKRHCSGKEASEYAIKSASLWESHLRDPSWYPFKVMTVKDKEELVLDEEDEKIASLKDEYETGVRDAVVTALKEIIEFNPGGRYPIPELWNNKEQRKASLKEGVDVLLGQWRTYKQRKLKSN